MSELLSITSGTAAKLLGCHTTGKSSSKTCVTCISRDNELYTLVEQYLDESLINSKHSFRLECLGIVSAPSSLAELKACLERSFDIIVYFLFHGTSSTNHDSIFKNGLEYRGMTDPGYIGKGVYLTPHVEYAASYIKGTSGVTRLKYTEPAAVGATFQILGCVAIVGRTKQLTAKSTGSTIPRSQDSHWAWVDSKGNPTGNSSKYFAVEYAIRESHAVCPRFQLTLKRVTRELVWVDQKITNSENSGYVAELKQTEGIFLYATSSAEKALQALKKRKPGTDYRAMTAGTGGQDFVSKLKAAGVRCKVLVFCGTKSVSYHESWAQEFRKNRMDIKVTGAVAPMKKFATWQA